MAPARYFRNSMPDSADGAISTDFIPSFVEKIVTDIEKAMKAKDRNCRTDLYLGTAGISYMYYHLSKIPTLNKFKQNFLKRSVEHIVSASKTSQSRPPKHVSSFIAGNSGIYAVASVIHQTNGDSEQSELYKNMFLQISDIYKKSNLFESDELFVGRAGYILGTLWLYKQLNCTPPLTEINTICDLMVESGRHYSRTHNSPCPLMYSYHESEYLGAAHGLCTILQALLTVPGYLEANPSHAQDIKASVDYLLTLQDQEGNFPSSTRRIGGAYELVHWCHGAGGMIYLMAKAFLVWKDEKYLNSCKKMGELIWAKGLLKKGPGICHGVAGNGYAFLLLYRLTQDEKYLNRAVNFARFLQDPQFLSEARTPDHPFSLYEGVAGTACFLGDLLCPQKAQFPFSDVLIKC